MSNFTIRQKFIMPNYDLPNIFIILGSFLSLSVAALLVRRYGTSEKR